MKEVLYSPLNMTPDFHPRTSNEADSYHRFDSMYSTLKQLYPAYGRMRFRGSPFMPEPPADLERVGLEDIADHMWMATITSRLLLPILPHTTMSVDGLKIVDMLLIHDIGEIANGDVSAVLQLQGHGQTRAEDETHAFHKIISDLPDDIKESLTATHDEYEREKNDPNTTNKEALIAKIIDTIQGNHYVLTHSPNFKEHAELHTQIVSTKLLPHTKRLEEILQDEGNSQGVTEMHLFTRHHLHMYQKRGVSIPYHIK